jgi:hypothetical protein
MGLDAAIGNGNPVHGGHGVDVVTVRQLCCPRGGNEEKERKEVEAR